jgi:hypothetical protein
VDAVRRGIPFGDGGGERIVVDRDDSIRAEAAPRDGQDSAAGSGIQHRPGGDSLSRDPFEQSQTHRGGGVLSRSESGLGWDNDRSRRLHLRGSRPANDQA